MTMTTTPTSELTAKPFLNADVLRRECESLMKEKADLTARLDAALAQNAAMRKALEHVVRQTINRSDGLGHDLYLEAVAVLSLDNEASASPPADPLSLLAVDDLETLREAMNDAADRVRAEPNRSLSRTEWIDRYAAMRDRLAKAGAE